MRRAFYLLFSLSVLSCGNPKNAADTQKEEVKKAPVERKGETKTILFFGNSLTAGYGLDNPQEQAFPARIQQKLDSLKLPYKAVNAGLSGETSAGGLGRIDWLLKQPVDVFVLELGANDGLRGIAVSDTKKNLQAILDKVKEKYPQAKILVTGMMVPPNMGEAYAKDFRTVFPGLAEKNTLTLMPFLLEGVAGERKLNQKDGIHPTAEGAQIVADNVWKILQPLL
ncbi:MAG: arylesterase [Mucilaginibacter polytrichastri]|nr:arylesterase [Mucilaginibacter polytrichastri]